LNGINSIKFDINATRYDVASSRKRIAPIGDFHSATETDKKKQTIIQRENNLDSNQNRSNTAAELLLSNRKYYRSMLLSEIYNKMSGVEPRSHPGQLVEYYA
jgi:hypothetical protein